MPLMIFPCRSFHAGLSPFMSMLMSSATLVIYSSSTQPLTPAACFSSTRPLSCHELSSVIQPCLSTITQFLYIPRQSSLLSPWISITWFLFTKTAILFLSLSSVSRTALCTHSFYYSFIFCIGLSLSFSQTISFSNNTIFFLWSRLMSTSAPM